MCTRFKGVSYMKKILLLIMVLFLNACDSKVLWEDEYFAVYWIDHPKYLSLGRKVDGVFLGMSNPPFSVGSNERYLVVKSQYGYYYYDKNIEDKSNQSLLKKTGPLSREEFLVVKKRLALPELQAEFLKTT